MINTTLLSQEIEERLNTRWLGRRLHIYQQLDSTNLTAMELAAEGAPEAQLFWRKNSCAGGVEAGDHGIRHLE